MSLWAVEFEHRSDDGPRLVGPFPTKSDASAWLSTLTFDYEANAMPLDRPEYPSLDAWFGAEGWRMMPLLTARSFQVGEPG